MITGKQFGLKERVIEDIREIARRDNVEKVVLFGSRARGDFYERSDIDLAFWGGDGAHFSLDVDEDTYTLLKFDIVDMGRPVQPELKESIEKEGITIYEKAREFQKSI